MYRRPPRKGNRPQLLLLAHQASPRYRTSPRRKKTQTLRHSTSLLMHRLLSSSRHISNPLLQHAPQFTFATRLRVQATQKSRLHITRMVKLCGWLGSGIRRCGRECGARGSWLACLRIDSRSLDVTQCVHVCFYLIVISLLYRGSLCIKLGRNTSEQHLFSLSSSCGRSAQVATARPGSQIRLS